MGASTRVFDRVRFVVLVVTAAMIGTLFGPSLSGAIVGGADPAPDDPLVFVPIVPCAVFDTRSSQDYPASIATGDTVTFVAAGAIPTSQINNGAGASCVAPPADVAAVEVNLIAVGPVGRGNLRIAKSGEALNASAVNFSVAADSANSNSVPVEVGPGGEIDVRVGGAAGVTVKIQTVIMGYYVRGTSVYESFDRIVVVGGSGTPAENGQALLDAVTAVQAQGPTDADPWLIKLEPGEFDIGTVSSGLDVAGGVNLAGSGAGATTIIGTQIFNTVRLTAGTMEISDITLVNNALTAIRNQGATMTISNSVLRSNSGTSGLPFSEGAAAVRNTGELRLHNTIVESGSELSIHNAGTLIAASSEVRNSNVDTAVISTGILAVDGSFTDLLQTSVFVDGERGVDNAGTLYVSGSHLEARIDTISAAALFGSGTPTHEVFNSVLRTFNGNAYRGGATATFVDVTMDSPDPVNLFSAVTCGSVTYLNPFSFNASSCP